MNTAIFLMVVAGGFFHAAWNFVAKKVNGNLVVIWFGFGTVALAYVPLAIYFSERHGIDPTGWALMAAGGLATTVYFWLIGRTYEKGEISFCYPILRGIGVGGMAFLTPFVLDQHPSLIGNLGIVCICAGILLISLRWGNVSGREGLPYALASGIMVITYSLISSLAVRVVHPVIYNIGLTLFAVLFLTPVILRKGFSEIRSVWNRWKWQGVFMGFCSVTGYFIVLFALQYGTASYVVALRDTSIGFGALLGFVFLKERFTWRKATGILAILAGAVLIKFA